MKDPEKFIERIEKKAQEWDISAVLSIRDRDGFQYQKAFGYADRAQDRPMTPEERFCLDTENGFFLTLCVMDLMEQKKLRLSDPVSRFLPEYKHGGRITVRKLLRWDSGLPDYWGAVRMPALQKDPDHAALSDQERFRREVELCAQDVSFQEVLGDIGQRELTHEPGKEDDGSVTGAVFLGEIVRRVSGMTAREYVFERFFQPLGMADTRPGSDATTALYGVMRGTELVPLPKLSNAGAFTTTPGDMELFARALAEKRFFSEKTWALMQEYTWHMDAFGFYKHGELYCAEFYPMKLRDTCQLWLNFDEGLSVLLLNSEEMKSKRDENGHWRSFYRDLRAAWLNTRVYPQNPELKRVNGKNIWDVLDIELLPEQRAFVPECSRCVAATLARKQPVYVLMDHDLPIGIAALNIEPKKKKYDVSFLLVDHRYQGRGYGRILLTRAIEVLKEKGATRLEIGVNRFNIPAQRLYRSVGFADKEVYDEFIEMEMTL